MRRLSRRGFIKTASVGLAVASGAGHAGQMMPGAGSANVIDPPAGEAFRDPQEMRSVADASGLIQVEVEPRVAPVRLAGTTVEMMTYNGAFPAPTIRVRRGDLLKVRFRNSLPESSRSNVLGFPENQTNLHTHGWHVSPEGNGDNVLLHFAPGETFEFVYDTSLQEPGTLGWYHPHAHGRVAEQIWAGLAGALVVEDETPVLSGYETHILVLKDFAVEGSRVEPHSRADYQWGKEGEIVTVNGLVNPVLSMARGQVQRWRVLNASTSRYYRLELEGHRLHLVGTDGGLLDRPYEVPEILLTPGERVDLLVRADRAPGAYRLRSLPYERGARSLDTVTLLTVVYDGGGGDEALPGVIRSDTRIPQVDVGSLPRRDLTLQMTMMMMMTTAGRGFINGQDFDRDPYVVDSRVGTYELWRVFNMSMMDHPFHQHTNPGFVWRISGGDRSYASIYTSAPAWKDTINVPRMGSVELIIPVEHYTGSSVYHCHIVEHEDVGMMGLWNLH